MRTFVRRLARRSGWLPAGAPILLYHRIAKPDIDPWELAVSPHAFEGQLDHLARHYAIIPLSELTARLSAGRPLRGCCSITFDDGYADNFTNAVPALERRGIPATIFVVSGTVGSGALFWWDELERLILSPPMLPDIIRVSVLGDASWTIDAESEPSDSDWRADDGPATSRQRVFLEIWQRLQPLPETKRKRALAEIALQVGDPPPVAREALPMTPEQIAQLARKSLIEIGGHTVSHPALTDLADADLDAELFSSRDQLRDLIGRLPAGMSYPHGQFNASIASRAGAAGFSYACTSIHAHLRVDADTMALPRCNVASWSPEQLAAALRELP